MCPAIGSMLNRKDVLTMFKRPRWTWLFAAVLAGFSGMPVQAQAPIELPRPEDPLSVRVDVCDKLIRANHLNEGLVLRDVVFAQQGRQTPLARSQEACAISTAAYLAALSFRYSVTQDPQARESADAAMAGILKLEQATGEPGCVARCFVKPEEGGLREPPSSFPVEWRESAALPGCLWMGNLGTDQFTALTSAVALYWEFCADDAHKKSAADFIDRVTGRCIANDCKIVESGGKMSLWGNFCPDLPHEPINALLMLANLKTALKATGKMAYGAAYTRLIAKYKYDDEVVLAKVLWPAGQRNDGEERAASLALYGLVRFEDNPDLVKKYRAALDRLWAAWKDAGDPWFHLAYQAGSGENAFDEKTASAMKQAIGVVRAKGSWTLEGSEGPKTVEAEHEDADPWLLAAYWLGRKLGAVDAQW